MRMHVITAVRTRRGSAAELLSRFNVAFEENLKLEFLPGDHNNQGIGRTRVL